MAITPLSMLQPMTDDDVVVRQRRQHQAVTDAKAAFTTSEVTIDFGPMKAKEKLTLRYEVGSSFAFATYQDNPKWHDRGREEWTAAAGDALEKFCAVREVQIIVGPRPEITNRYNLFVEIRGAVT